MSRIDLSAADEAGTPIFGRGFCRSHHLEVFCEDTGDELLETFAHDVRFGIELDRATTPAFVDRLERVLARLRERVPSATEPAYVAESHQAFLDDLVAARAAIRELHDSGQVYTVEIL